MSGWERPDGGGLCLVDLFVEVGVLDGEQVHGSGERFARDPILVALLPQVLDRILEGGDLRPQCDLVVGDAIAGLAFGIEEVFEVGVLVRQLVALEPRFPREGDDVQGVLVENAVTGCELGF
ncbi:hypothetical protein [Kutzneria sp. 744]|uniref:hypothetical protein n=1 Tax=Kutzneria sp. (strain 744) TaxID=345341 RepID=UPI0012F9E03F|nr:hypothetical protein [Kutzneria sp. 744]